MTIMDGKAVAQDWKQDMRRMLLMCKTPPCLAVISVGEDSASQVYIRNKKKACEEMGLRFEDCHFPASVTLKELATTIRRLNEDETVNLRNPGTFKSDCRLTCVEENCYSMELHNRKSMLVIDRIDYQELSNMIVAVEIIDYEPNEE